MKEITVRLHSDSVSTGNISYIADSGEILPFGGQAEDMSTPTETILKIKIALPIFKPFLIIIKTLCP